MNEPTERASVSGFLTRASRTFMHAVLMVCAPVGRSLHVVAEVDEVHFGVFLVPNKTLKTHDQVQAAMVESYDYKALLQRLKNNLPKKAAKGDWFEVPHAKISVVRRKTVVENFKDIAELFQRDPQQLYLYLTKKLGAAGTIEGDKLVLNNLVSQEQVDALINKYYQDYVRCPVCGRPDTVLEKRGRLFFIKCLACGAETPVKNPLRD